AVRRRAARWLSVGVFGARPLARRVADEPATAIGVDVAVPGHLAAQRPEVVHLDAAGLELEVEVAGGDGNPAIARPYLDADGKVDAIQGDRAALVRRETAHRTNQGSSKKPRKH